MLIGPKGLRKRGQDEEKKIEQIRDEQKEVESLWANAREETELLYIRQQKLKDRVAGAGVISWNNCPQALNLQLTGNRFRALGGISRSSFPV